MEIIKPDLGEKLLRVYHDLKTEGRLRNGMYKGETFPYVLFDLAELPEETPFERFAFGINRASEADRTRVYIEREIGFGNKKTYRRLIENLGFLIFVCREHGPEEFQPLWAIHEYVEGFTDSHEYATKAVFEEAKRISPEFLDRFARYFAWSLKDVIRESRKDALRSVIPAEVIPIFEEMHLI